MHRYGLTRHHAVVLPMALVTVLVLAGCGSQTPTTAPSASRAEPPQPTETSSTSPVSPIAAASANPSPQGTTTPALPPTVDDLFASPLPKVSAKAVVALVPPAGGTVIAQIPSADHRKLNEFKRPVLSNLDIVVRLCVAGSPVETSGERAVERQIDCMVAVAGAWRDYATSQGDLAKFTLARSIYAYAMSSVDGVGARYVDRVLRAQLPLILSTGPVPASPSPSPGALISVAKFLAVPDSPVSSVVGLTRIRDNWASRLAELVSGPQLNGIVGWTSRVVPEGAAGWSNLGTFGEEETFDYGKTWQIVSYTGRCIRDPNPADGFYGQHEPWTCIDLVGGFWSHYRRTRSQADYDTALAMLHFAFDRVGGQWNHEIVDSLAR